MDKKHKGAVNELIACAWLLKEGYEVFRNVSPYGFADLIVFKDGKMLRLDVKSSSIISKTRLTQSQIDDGVLPFYVFGDGSCELGKGNEPPKYVQTIKVCKHCKKDYLGINEKQLYCSVECRVSFYENKGTSLW